MVLVRRGVVDVDMDRTGGGPPVLLLGGISRQRMWAGLTDTLSDRYRVLTLDLHGQGATPAWPGTRSQTLADQVRLVHALTAGGTERIGIVGHSIGAAVALRAAVELDERVAAVVAVEPTAFALLGQAGRTESWRAVQHHRDRLRLLLAAGEIEEAARDSSDFWLGAGSWERYTPDERAPIEQGLHHRLAEWDAVTDPALTLAEVATAPAPTLLAVDPDTLVPVREVADVLTAARPDWERAELRGAGHFAPLTRPDLVHPLVEDFLDRHLRP
ncbi:alpha/beta fold hydrolase [Pseudonocardia pini]|uniref:alpha/beta fold hydrolase n=1 Tax=Pseudonocardia pini TaxID=2758030 RepID=UPI0015F0149D|nr:alpha/beta hydrolase [Pseudonocardia pini]